MAKPFSRDYDEDEPSTPKASQTTSSAADGKEDEDQAYYHWSKRNGLYRPVGHTQDQVPAGIYEIDNDNSGWFLSKVKFPSDNLLRLPGMPIDYILNQIDTFWKREELFKQTGLLHKRGILMYGPAGCGKCLGRGTPVLMHSGAIKNVEDVRVGDLLMGPDSKPRHVLSTAQGRDAMYRINPVKGDPWVCNEPHILSLKVSHKKEWSRESGDRVEISLKDYLSLAKHRKRYLKLHRSEAIKFPTQPVPVDPYLVGLWLGDGQSDLRSFAITSDDHEIEQYLIATAGASGMSLRTNDSAGKRCPTYKMSTGRVSGLGKEGRNPMTAAFRKLGLAENKHIPVMYKVNSRESRLKLMAGLFDSDGWPRTGCCEITSKFEALANDVAFVCRSLGWAACVKEKFSTLNGKRMKYFRVSIVGDLSEVPVKIPRKRTASRKQVKNPLHTGFKAEPLGIGEYFGFELDGDGLFLLGDFTVTHNTSIIRLLCDDIVHKRDGIVVMVTNCRLAETALSGIRQIEPRRPILTIIEDIETFMGSSDESSSARALLALLDGETQVDHVVHLATTNKPDLLEDRIVKRPGRFDLVIGLNHPVADARKAYLFNLLKDHVSEEELQSMVDDTEGLGLAHLRELVVANYCLGLDRKETLARLKTNFKSKLNMKGKKETGMGFTTTFVQEEDGKVKLDE